MSRSWAKRIQKVESILNIGTQPAMKVRYGYVRRLPEDVEGDRHIGISKSEFTALPNVELCEFEEQLGPAPDAGELSFDVYMSAEDEQTSPANEPNVGGQRAVSADELEAIGLERE